MRIRRRPPFSSPSHSPSIPTPSPVSDPSFNAPPATLLMRDAAKDAAVHSTQALHQQRDLPTGTHHGTAQGPNRSAVPRHQLPVHHLESQANAKGCIRDFSFPHPAGDGRLQVLRREELKIEDDGEDMVDSNKKGCQAVKVNSNNRIVSSGAGALILLEAAQRLEESAALAKKEAIALPTDGGDKGEDETLEGKTSKSRRRRPASWSNGCTSDVNEKHRVAAGAGGGETSPATAQAKDEDKLLAANGNGGNAAASNGKKRRSPAVLMEGSRCSRVNGRGWRCCQQTLVGYSLCEHHLGKGRLRSMSSVRGQIGATTRPKRNHAEGVDAKRAATSPSPFSAAQEQEDKPRLQHQPPQAAVAGVDSLVAEEGEGIGVSEGANNNSNEDTTITRKKRKKMGMVKARSISSLLDGGQVDPSPEPSTEATKVLPQETMV